MAYAQAKITDAEVIPVIDISTLRDGSDAKSVARALHAGVELDQDIPEDHYKAVAEVIAYVMRLKGTLPPSPASAGGHS